MKILQKIKKIINASILCLKYPFLYPRNRWDNKHHARILSKQRYKLYEKSIEEIYLTAKLSKGNEQLCESASLSGFNFLLDKENQKIIISSKYESKEIDLYYLLWNSKSKFKILGMEIDQRRHPHVCIIVKTSDETDKTNYGFCYNDQKFIINTFKYKLYKLTCWIDEKILDKIFFLPDCTELDAMEPGWRKAFGLDICKEIKSELKKHKGALKKYRIMQIKEKFGKLCWYDNGSPEKIWKEIIPKYEKLSRQICIHCGNPAEYISKGWISPYCSNCIENKEDCVKITEENAWDKALYPWDYKENE